MSCSPWRLLLRPGSGWGIGRAPIVLRLGCRAAHLHRGHATGPRPSSRLLMATADAPEAVTEGLLTGSEDAYDGLILEPASLPASAEEFATLLPGALECWRQRGYRGIWLKVPATHAHLVGHAVDHGFEFHHAEKDYVMLTQWLPGGENKLPPNASHQVGVGAFVLNERREVLVVQEKLGPLRGRAVWKMPTGLVQAGEDISAAAEREVLEETGVRARFDGVLAMRQAHGFAFGKSDFFFVVALKPEPGQQELKMQEDELVGVRWMPLEEYVQIPFIASRPLLAKITQKCVEYADGRYAGLTGQKMAMGDSARSDLLLFGETPSPEAVNPTDLWIGLGAGGGDAAAGGGGGGGAGGSPGDAVGGGRTGGGSGGVES